MSQPPFGTTDEATPIRDEPISADVLATPSEGLEARAQRSKRVGVIGGGLAGLVAPFELERQGHDVIVLESRDRVGRRIYTLRTFAPSLYRRPVACASRDVIGFLGLAAIVLQRVVDVLMTPGKTVWNWIASFDRARALRLQPIGQAETRVIPVAPDEVGRARGSRRSVIIRTRRVERTVPA